MNFGWQNVIDGHGIGIMLTGMLIVFSGLVFISLVIVLLGRMDRKKAQDDTGKATSAAASADQEPTMEELVTVAALIVHMETERSLGEASQLTIPRQSRHGSIWASAGKMRSLSEGGSYA